MSFFDTIITVRGRHGFQNHYAFLSNSIIDVLTINCFQIGIN